uniref:Uncharacterized protein n=1 Tax=Acrobeloides nanus TaxID=290746 RepID=A0A914CE05_9BILA
MNCTPLLTYPDKHHSSLMRRSELDIFVLLGMRISFFLIINALKFGVNYACLSTPTLESVTVPKSTTEATKHTTACTVRVKKDTGLAETVCPTTTPHTETTTILGETTTIGIGETTTVGIGETTTTIEITTTTTSTTTTITTTTTTPIPCVPPAGSAGLRISAADFALNNDATFGANIPVTGSCPCGSVTEVFSPGQAALDPNMPPTPPMNFAIILCNYPGCDTPPCPMQCACTSTGACYIFAADLATSNFENIVRYYPLNDGTFYAYVDNSLSATQIFDDQTMMAVTTLPTPFQVASVGCGGCPALRASMASTCTATGPYTPAAG